MGWAWGSGCYFGSGIIGSDCAIGVPSRYLMNVCGMNTSLDESAVGGKGMSIPPDVLGDS